MIRAVLGANVLYQAAVRDTLLTAAEAGLFEPFWSAEILAEVERNLVARFIRRQLPNPHERWHHLLAQLTAAFPVAAVAGHEPLIPTLTNHPGDRHVLAVAVQIGADRIVTHNLRDFPAAALQPHRVLATSPDDFLIELFDEAPAPLIDALIAQGARLRRPRTLAATLAQLQGHTPRFARAVRDQLG